MNKLIVLLFLVGLVKVFGQTTEAPDSALSEKHKHRQHRLGKADIEKIKEVVEKNETKAEVDAFVNSLNQNEQKHAKKVIKHFEKVEKLEQKLSTEDKAAFQKIIALKNQEHEILKSLPEKDREEAEHVIREAHLHHRHHEEEEHKGYHKKGHTYRGTDAPEGTTRVSESTPASG